MIPRAASLMLCATTAVSMPAAPHTHEPRRLQGANVEIGDVSLMVNQLSASVAGYTTYQVGIRFDPGRVLDVYGTLPHIA